MNIITNGCGKMTITGGGEMVKCVHCGGNAKIVRGSLKHPYCQACFYKVWNNDYQAYGEYMDKFHGHVSVDNYIKRWMVK